MAFSSAIAHEVLEHYFGYSTFRTGQEDIVRSIVNGRDTVVVMPTGGGKSLCYQIPALLCEGVALVISPLIALMQDQVDALLRARIPAAFINSTLSHEEINERLAQARNGLLKLLYIAPERLDSTSFLEELRTIRPAFLAIDEAHCISEWGHDFRPSYLQIARLFTAIGRIPVIALTATATAEVRSDIVRCLEMRNPHVVIRGFDRPNLTYFTEATKNKAERIGDILDETREGSTIIYCGSRKRVEEFTDRIRDYKHYVLAYHAGLADRHRQYAQEEFLSGRCKILVATSAFGMGIDKPDVRNVIHCDLTLTLEAYYQEAGRAGRDGLPSNCTILYQAADRRLMEFFIRSTYPERNIIRAVYETLFELTGTPLGTKSTAPILLDNRQIANRANVAETGVAAVMSLFELHGITRQSKANPFGSVQFTTSHERIKEYFHNTTGDRRTVLSALLRSVGSQALDAPTEIDIPTMFAKHDLTPETFDPAIRALEHARILRFQSPGKDGGLTLALERMPFERLPIDFEALDRRRERAYLKLDIVERYVNTSACKRNFILSYFEESGHLDNCGRCSGCTAPPENGNSLGKREEFLLQTLFSACSELNGRFGITVLTDVILGESSKKVTELGLHRFESFGQAKEFSRKDVEAIIEFALKSKLVRQSPDLYPTISLTEEGIRQTISLRKPATFDSPAQTTAPEELIKLLQLLRQDYATQDAVPPSSLISDDMLTTIAIALPATLKDLAEIEGASSAFVARCGRGVVECIREYLADSAKEAAQEKLPPTIAITIAMLNKGKSLQQISEERDMLPATVAQHIESAVQEGALQSWKNIVSEELFSSVKNEVQNRKNITLKELRYHIGSSYGYPELRVAAAFARRELGITE